MMEYLLKDAPIIQLIIARKVAENLNLRLTNSEEKDLEKDAID